MAPLALRLALAAAAVAGANGSAGVEPDVAMLDPTPLGPREHYLAPYVDQLAELRDSPIGRRFVFLAELVDVLPAWLVDWFVPLFIPHSTLTIPIDKTIPIHIPGLPSELEIVDLSINDLNKFTVLRPARLLPYTKFTWASHLALAETTITLNTRLIVNGTEGTARFTLPSKQLDFEAEVVVAFERSRLCEVWGATMRSSAACALQPFFADNAAGVSGLNITDLRVSLADFDLVVEVFGFGPLAQKVAKLFDESFRAAKTTILAALPGFISTGLRDVVNVLAFRSVTALHEAGACPVSTLPPNGGFEKVVNVSRVCINNNAGFALTWNYANCPAHSISRDSGAYPADVKRCMDVETAFPGAVEGQILRVQTLAIAGIHHVIDPAFRYVKDSNAAAFECSGSTLLYDCDFVSVVPISPSSLPEVSEVCVINQAGFAMYFESADERTKTLAGRSRTYAANQRDCMSLVRAPGAVEGDKFVVVVHAIAGRKKPASRELQYRNNSMTATFMCKGSTLDYDCTVLELTRTVPIGSKWGTADDETPPSPVQILV